MTTKGKTVTLTKREASYVWVLLGLSHYLSLLLTKTGLKVTPDVHHQLVKKLKEFADDKDD